MIPIFLPSFLDLYCPYISCLGSNAFCLIINFLILWSICLIFFLFILKIILSNFQGCLHRCLSLLWYLCRCAYFPELSHTFKIDFYFHPYLLDGIRFHYFQIAVIVFLFKRSDIASLLPNFIISMIHFSMPIPIPSILKYILTLCSTIYCSFSFSFLFCK